MPGRRAGGESGGSLGPLAGLGSRGLPGADSGWGWGLRLVAAGAEVRRGRGRALLEQDRLRFPRHHLTHSLAAAQVGGIAPKEVAARTLWVDGPPTLLVSSGVDPLGAPRANLLACIRVWELGTSTVARWGACVQIRAVHVRARTALRAWWQAVCQPAGVHVRRRAAEREIRGHPEAWHVGGALVP